MLVSETSISCTLSTVLLKDEVIAIGCIVLVSGINEYQVGVAKF